MSGLHDHSLPVLPAASGFLERRDARAKVAVAVAFVLGVVLAPLDARRLGALAGVAVLLACLGATPPWRVALRAAVVLPFAVMGSIFLPLVEPDGWRHAADIVARASISGLVVAAVGSATDLSDLVRALGSLGVPRAVVVTMHFTLRYLVLLRDEGARVMLARELRTFGWRPRLALRAMGHSVGTLFVRTFERAERVHSSMAARGFTGSFPTVFAPRLGALDGALFLAVLGAVLAIDLAPV